MIKNVLKRYSGKVVTMSDEDGKPVAIVELDERIIPMWDISPKVLYRMAFVCNVCDIDVGDDMEVLVIKKK